MATTSDKATRHQLLAKTRNQSEPRTDAVNVTTTGQGSARSWLRQVLDVLNLILIAFFLFQLSTEFQPCAGSVDNIATTERKVPANISHAIPATTELSAISVDYKTLLNSGLQTDVCVMASSGLCSQIMQILAQKIFYDDRSMQFIVDESQYGYKWDDQTGVLSGFFQPRFPVLGQGEFTKYISEPFGGPSLQTVMKNRAFGSARSPDQKIVAQWAINEGFRKSFVQNYGKDGFPLYNRFATEACNNLQFNPQARKVIRELIQERSEIVDLRKSHSVAFHIRRGDKVTLRESRAYAGSEYVDKLVGVLQSNHVEIDWIQDCFVASDSLDAVEEIRKSLKDHNFGCKMHSIASRTENQAGENKGAYQERDLAVEFLAEVSLLLDATYFIGTFNSNVGAVVALLRKCHYYGAPHYAHSYGVDTEGWFYRS